MAKYVIEDTSLTNMADAIREKTGGTEPITPSNFATEIAGIQSAPTITKGLIINKYSSTGNAEDITIRGMSTIPSYYCGINSTSYENFLTKGLEKVTIEEGTTSINSNAFRNCDSLNNIILPEGITSIGTRAFDGCTYLNTTLPSTLTTLGEYAFNQCQYGSIANKTVPTGITSFPSYVFYGIRVSFEEIPEGITSIGSSAFGYSNIEITKLPETLTTLGTDAFRYCNMESIEIPTGITVLNSGVFNNCTNLLKAACKGNVTQVKSTAFNNCSVLGAFLLPNITSVPTLDNTNSFTNTPIESGTGYIYVPDNLVESFKIATNWSTYASQIKPISELEGN